MKKEYIKPSMKAIEMKVETVILAGSGELDLNPSSTTSNDGVQFNDFEDSNGESSTWEL
jgi:hypothetical protein